MYKYLLSKNAQTFVENTLSKHLKEVLLAPVLLGGTFLSPKVSAQVIEWNGAGNNTSWSNSGNWVGNVVPNGAGQNAKFVDLDTALNNKNITLGNVTLGSLEIGSLSNAALNSFKLSNGTLNFDNSGSPASLVLSGFRELTLDNSVSIGTNADLMITNNSAYATGLNIQGGINMGGIPLP